MMTLDSRPRGRTTLHQRADSDMIDEKKLQQFLGKMIVDLGAAISVPLVRIGIRLGLYKAMNGAGPMSSAEFAKQGKHLRTLCPRMARAKRGLRLSDLRTRQPTI